VVLDLLARQAVWPARQPIWGGLRSGGHSGTLLYQ
jgi:hypothetical protein